MYARPLKKTRTTVVLKNVKEFTFRKPILRFLQNVCIFMDIEIF